jgi:hypothetical protein
MMFCAILYGEIRTLEICIPSIKRLFCDILNVDFYVVINKSKKKYDYTYYENLIKTNLNVKSYDLCDMSQSNLILFQNKKPIYKDLKIKTNAISFEDYSKLPFNENLYTNSELENFNNKKEIELSSSEISAYPYNQYIEDFLINIAMKKIPTNSYSHIFRLRTDVVWFDNWNIKNKYIFKNSINKLCLNKEYNEHIQQENFENLKTQIINNIDDNKIIISSLHLVDNIKMPCAHAQLMPFMVFKKYVEFFNDNNIENILEQIQKYPVLYPNWGGELQQKKVFQYLNMSINSNVYFHFYSCILRE